VSAEVVEPGLLSFADLGRVFGVSTNQVWTWYQRREANGFPEPADTKAWGRKGRRVPLFEADAVEAWLAQYEPSKAPVRSRHALSREVWLPDGQKGPLPQGWLTQGQVAAHFGVTVKVVWNWVHRRETNGFPLPKGQAITASGRECKDVFDVDEVDEWRRFYRPANGRPRVRGR
jgi:transposase